jgi:signal transduction histidine kinase
MRRIGLRYRLIIIVSLGAALAIGALTLIFNLTLRSSLHQDANSVVSARATTALGTVAVENGQVRSREAPDQGAVDAQVWIYSGQHAVERPRASQSVQALAESLARGPTGYADDSATDTRLYATPITHGGHRVGTAVAALSLEPYERSASRTLVASLIFAGAILALIVVGAAWSVRRALRPVDRMTAEAASWSESDLDHRFNVGEPHDELTRLASTFDHMLDRLATSLRREQRFSAELSHELRTPLAAVSAEAELALARERRGDEYRAALEVIRTRATQLERTLEALLAAARAESGAASGTSDAMQVAEQAKEACETLAREREISIRVTPPRTPVRIGAQADAAERVLTPLLENACRYGGHSVLLSVIGGADTVEFRVADDGPGVDPGERDRIFEPGLRGAAAENGSGDGAGLGLSLARRLARGLGGEVDCVASANGAVFVARLPTG